MRTIVNMKINDSYTALVKINKDTQEIKVELTTGLIQKIKNKKSPGKLYFEIQDCEVTGNLIINKEWEEYVNNYQDKNKRFRGLYYILYERNDHANGYKNHISKNLYSNTLKGIIKEITGLIKIEQF